MKNIKICSNCNLCKNQTPLLDNKNSSDVMWIGLSAKKVSNLFEETPLDSNTNTGKIIADVENKFENINFYKTNLVKCLPLDNNKKLRYPNTLEMDACYTNLRLEIDFLKPSVVFLLGKKVSDFILNHHKKNASFLKHSEDAWSCENTTFIAVQHPSYIHVYKRKHIKEYVHAIQKIIENELLIPLKHAS